MMDKIIVDALAKRVASNQTETKMTLEQVPEFYKASVQSAVNGGNK